MEPRNRLTEYFAGETSGRRGIQAHQQGTAFEAAARALDATPEVARHVRRVRSSVAELLRSLHALEHERDPDEQAVVDSCLTTADALEDLLVFLFPRSAEAADEPSDDGEDGDAAGS